MKVIDLLNKIANGEILPKKINYNDNIYYLDDEWSGVCYRREDNHRIFEDFFVFENLNDEVEILEDTPEVKKIDKLDLEDLYKIIDARYTDYEVRHIIHKILLNTKDKINEIIDKVNGGNNE